MGEDRRSGLRQAMVLAVAVGAALLAIGICARAAPAVAVGDKVYQRELAYAQCMRAHGDPGFPDPQARRAFISTIANPVRLPRPGACRPTSVLDAMPPGQAQGRPAAGEFTSQARGFCALLCMRAHGITNFQYSAPQPGHVGALGAPGADVNSPRFQAAQRACRKLKPAFGGGS